jgi:hypothetical protein
MIKEEINESFQPGPVCLEPLLMKIKIQLTPILTCRQHGKLQYMTNYITKTVVSCHGRQTDASLQYMTNSPE